MIHVVLDTGIYTQDKHRTKPPFKSLEWLGKSDALTLHIPYVVRREFETQMLEACEKNLNGAIKATKELSKGRYTDNNCQNILRLHNNLNNIQASLIADTNQEFSLWADEIKASHIPLCLEQSQKSMEAYFNGTAPFKEPKIRKDIPDSFVARAVEKTASNIPELHFVVHDKKLREAFETVPNITTYTTLSEFISSDLIQEKLLSLSVLENYEELKHQIETIENQEQIFKLVIEQEIGELLINKEIKDSSIPDDNHIATINSYYDPSDIQLDYEHSIYLGDNKIGIPFSLKLEVIAYYYIYKGDYYLLDENEMPSSVTDHNDHYYEAEDDFYISVTGVTTATIDEDKVLSTGQLEDAIDPETITVAEIIDIELTD